MGCGRRRVGRTLYIYKGVELAKDFSLFFFFHVSSDFQSFYNEYSLFSQSSDILYKQYVVLCIAQ